LIWKRIEKFLIEAVNFWKFYFFRKPLLESGFLIKKRELESTLKIKY